jgi:hypothetical protein
MIYHPPSFFNKNDFMKVNKFEEFHYLNESRKDDLMKIEQMKNIIVEHCMNI